MKLQLVRHNDPFKQLISEYLIEDHLSLNEALLEFVSITRQKDPRGITNSNSRGWHSKPDLASSDHKSIKALNQFVFAAISNYIQAYQPNFNIGNYNVRLAMWANVNNEGASNAMHVHPNSLISGTYYVKIPSENVPKICFLSTNGAQYLKNRQLLSEDFCRTDYTYLPRPGAIILFPSNVFHSVEPNTTSEERISIAFNVYLDGK